MEIDQKLGIFVFLGVPAIIGGGIVYHFFGGLIPVFIFEVILVLAFGAFVSK